MACIHIPDWFVPELRIIFSYSWTMMIIALFSNLMGPISVMFCGHLGTKKLDGVALANTIINISGASISIGLSTACDTFFAQSFGSPNKKMVGVYLQRAMMVILLFLFPCWAFQLNAETLLIAMGQDREIARICGRYLLYFMPGMIGMFLQNILLRYLRTQNILWPPMIIGAIGVVVNALCHYLLLYVGNMDTEGSAIAQVIAFYTIAGGCLVYIFGFKIYKPTWGGWTLDAFQDWGVFLKLALGGMCTIFMEILSFEVGTILSGLIGEVQLAAMSIMFQLDIICYMIPIGVGTAANIRVGHLVGAGEKVQAMRAIKISYGLVQITVTVVALLLVLLRFEIPKIFSNSEPVINYCASLMMIQALYFLSDGAVAVGGGILRGCGRQVACACVNLFAFYMVGLPMGIPLMFLTNLETAGYWWGLTVGMLVQGSTFLVIVLRLNWDEMIEVAKERTAGYEKEIEEDEARALISEKKASDEIRKPIRYCNSAVSSSVLSLPPPTPTYEPLGPSLLFKRTIFILIMILTLALGIFLRFHFYYADEDVTAEILCIPRTNSTHNATALPYYNNSSLPVCNYTLANLLF